VESVQRILIDFSYLVAIGIATTITSHICTNGIRLYCGGINDKLRLLCYAKTYTNANASASASADAAVVVIANNVIMVKISYRLSNGCGHDKGLLL
jgi:hypothetical protein